ncbi:MAG: hypothetical protein ABEK16_05870 [Candidatus Nanohalobium sp.]
MTEDADTDEYGQLTDAELENNSEIHLDYPSETLHRVGQRNIVSHMKN